MIRINIKKNKNDDDRYNEFIRSRTEKDDLCKIINKTDEDAPTKENTDVRKKS